MSAVKPITSVKGDSLFIDVKVNTDLTNWKIRAELYDSNNNVKKGSSNVLNGDITQIDITDPPNGMFTIKFYPSETVLFDNAYLEVELEDPDGNKYTVIQTKVYFRAEKITWDAV